MAYYLGVDLGGTHLRAAVIDIESGELLALQRVLTLADLGSKMDEMGGPISASVSIRAEKWGPSFAAHIVDGEADGRAARSGLGVRDRLELACPRAAGVGASLLACCARRISGKARAISGGTGRL